MPEPVAPLPIRADHGETAGELALEIDPTRFYDADYIPVLAALVLAIIAAESPITLRRLARLVARRHGFQRTGREIMRVVRETAERLARITLSGDGDDVLWAVGTVPAPTMSYRGPSVSDEPRTWAETPHPEKLGFALAFLDQADPARAMADALKLGRLTAPTRQEFEALMADARRL